jgi:hypothetical protein
LILNEWLNGYELGFGSGLSPNRSNVRLLRQILANGLVERVHTQWPDRPTAAGALGLDWGGSKAESAAPRENREMGAKKEKLVGPGSASSWVSAHCQIGIRKSFSFSNLFIICKLI